MDLKYTGILCHAGNAKEMELENEFFLISKELGIAQNEMVLITSYTDDEGIHREEIWCEFDAGFPKINEIGKVLSGSDDWENCFYVSVGFLDIPDVGNAIVMQDASPMGIFLKKEDADKLNLDYMILPERFELYIKLEQEMRHKYAATVITKTNGNHTEVSVSNVGRNTKAPTAQIVKSGVCEPLHETFIKAAESFIIKVNE